VNNQGRSKEEKEKGVLVILFLLPIMRSHFAKQGIKMAPAPTRQRFVELKQKKNGFTSEVKPCQMGSH
jgi:hypothetical protein